MVIGGLPAKWHIFDLKAQRAIIAAATIGTLMPFFTRADDTVTELNQRRASTPKAASVNKELCEAIATGKAPENRIDVDFRQRRRVYDDQRLMENLMSLGMPQTSQISAAESLKALSQDNLKKHLRALSNPAAPESFPPETDMALIDYRMTQLKLSYRLEEQSVQPAGGDYKSIRASMPLRDKELLTKDFYFRSTYFNYVNDVHFAAEPYFEGVPFPSEGIRAFGKFPYLNENFSSPYAYVMPVMDSPEHGIILAARYFPEIFENTRWKGVSGVDLLNAFREWPVTKSHEFLGPEQWRELARRLHTLVFTPEDFLTLMRATLRSELIKIYQRDRFEYDNLFFKLKIKDFSDGDFESLINTPMVVLQGWALRVPVSVPMSATQILTGPDYVSGNREVDFTPPETPGPQNPAPPLSSRRQSLRRPPPAK